MKKFLFLILILSLYACSSSKIIKKDITLPELTNYSISGIQEDKIRQANDSFYRGSFNQAIEVYKSLIDSFMAIDNQDAIFNLLIIISDTYIESMNYQKAIETLQAAKNRLNFILIKTKNKYKYEAMYLTTLSRLLVMYEDKELKEIKSGIILHSLLVSKQIKDPNILIKTYTNMGFYYLSTNEIDKALEYFEKALILSNYTGKKYSYAYSCEMIGLIHTFKENFESASDYFITAYNLYASYNYSFPIARLLIKIADLLVKQQDLFLAYSFYNRAQEIFKMSEEIDTEIKNVYLKILENKIISLEKTIKLK